MKRLIITLIVCSLVVLIGLIGLIGSMVLGVIIGVLIIAAPFIALKYLKKPTGTGTPPGIKNYSWLAYAFLVLFACSVTWWFTHHQQKLTNNMNVASQTKQVSKTVQYEWYWKLPPGVFSGGRNENAADERLAEIIPQNDNSLLYADVPYFEYGSPYRERIRLVKTGENTWEGTWEQDNPEDRARVVVDRDGRGYHGTITWKEDGTTKVGRCHLIPK